MFNLFGTFKEKVKEIYNWYEINIVSKNNITYSVTPDKIEDLINICEDIIGKYDELNKEVINLKMKLEILKNNNIYTIKNE